MNKMVQGKWRLLFIVGLVLAGCNDDSGVASNETTSHKAVAHIVETIDAKALPFYTVRREYAGVVKSGQVANVGFELSGKVLQLLVDVGDSVLQGEPLIRLDTDLLTTEASQLNAQKTEVNAQLNLVLANLKRQRSLKKKGFSAEAEIDSLISQQGVLQAHILRIKAEIKANQLRQNKSTIFAPFSGVIAKRFVSLGDVVTVGSTTLTLLSDTDKEAFIGIPANQLTKISALTAPQIRVGEQTYLAKLLNPGAMVDTYSRSVGLRYLMPNDTAVLEGQLAYLQFDERVEEQGYWVPLTALIDGLRGVWNLFIVNGDGYVERRSIQVLFADHQQAYVQGALEDNEAVIASGLHRVVPGQSVQALSISNPTQ
ncbi:efflux RND transporter periplasmic adaptor subunit [Vibrio sp. 10N.286.49.B3]|uniref:efflux RND transporter periplasmic adaptor subunit n=1 Tax=Vibrio sp. 10N.286.49.B3 TaxID=1880855 RepID=UPI001F52E7D1|nr:efflux RND transporter periplasmic adaptor subunit [Vibrio sp. 10N.286.49.B3]